MFALRRARAKPDEAQRVPALPSYVTDRGEEVMWRLGFLEGHQSAIAEMKRAAPPPPGMARRVLCILLAAARLVLVAVLVWCLVQAAMALGYRRAMIDMSQSSSMPPREGMAARPVMNADLKPADPAVVPTRFPAP